LKRHQHRFARPILIYQTRQYSGPLEPENRKNRRISNPPVEAYGVRCRHSRPLHHPEHLRRDLESPSRYRTPRARLEPPSRPHQPPHLHGRIPAHSTRPTYSRRGYGDLPQGSRDRLLPLGPRSLGRSLRRRTPQPRTGITVCPRTFLFPSLD